MQSSCLDGRRDGRTEADTKLGHRSLPSSKILFRNFLNVGWNGYGWKQLVRSYQQDLCRYVT